MQKITVIFIVFFAVAYSRPAIDEESDEAGRNPLSIREGADEGAHYPPATSHQNIHIVHYHAVPTFIKKEFVDSLKHPVSIGDSSSSSEVHHAVKRGWGYDHYDHDYHYDKKDDDDDEEEEDDKKKEEEEDDKKKEEDEDDKKKEEEEEDKKEEEEDKKEEEEDKKKKKEDKDDDKKKWDWDWDKDDDDDDDQYSHGYHGGYHGGYDGGYGGYY